LGRIFSQWLRTSQGLWSPFWINIDCQDAGRLREGREGDWISSHRKMSPLIFFFFILTSVVCLFLLYFSDGKNSWSLQKCCKKEKSKNYRTK
jgi:hypothetical protein